ncbi:MAG: hypothetical protein ACP5K2_00900 [bacterium]
MVRFYKILFLLVLVLISTQALASERFRMNVRAGVEEEIVGVELEYNLSYKLYINGGFGLNLQF